VATVNTDSQAAGEYEPYMRMQFLPRCAQCFTPHPLARKPQEDPASCPDCGTPTGRLPREKTVKAAIHGPLVAVAAANACFWIGRKLRALAKRIEP
jgi:hypothetical protein